MSDSGGTQHATKADRALHHVIDFYGCDLAQIDQQDFWDRVMHDAAREANMAVLSSTFQRFQPHGLTGVLLLSTSHLSVHTWPEHRYAACDLFTCAAPADAVKAVEHLVRSVTHESLTHQILERGYLIDNWLDLPVYATGASQRLRIERVIANVESAFHKILVAQIEGFGRCLLLDGVMQCAESDHQLYDKALLAPLRRSDRRFLILGGGDGYVAQEALNRCPECHVTVVDIDQAVVAAAREHPDQDSLDDRRVELVIGDGLAYLKRFKSGDTGLMDGLVLDLTDNPVGGGDKPHEFRRFHRELLSLASRALKPGGWLSIQAGASRTSAPYIEVASFLESELRKRFPRVKRLDRLIPSFGERNCFLQARSAA